MLTIATLHEELDKGLDPDDVRAWLAIWEYEQAEKAEQAEQADEERAETDE